MLRSFRIAHDHQSLLLCCVLLAAPVAAQGVVNPSLLAPQPDDAAAAAARTVGSRAAVRAAAGAVAYVAVEVDGARGTFLIERASSGVVVGDGSYLVTWTRLVSEAQGAKDKRLVVQWPDDARTKVSAELVRSDAITGLSLLRLGKSDRTVRALKVATAAPEPGLQITVVGCEEGKVLVAFEGVLSSALADVTLAGQTVSKDAVVLTDARADARCDGAAVIDQNGDVVGLVSAEHVRRDVSEPTLRDLQQPSYLVVLKAAAIHKAFAAELGAGVVAKAANAPTGPGVGAVAAASPSIVGVYGGKGAWPVASGRDPGASMRTEAVGSGVLIAAPGLIVTNNHLVPTEDAQVALADGSKLPAKVQKRHLGLNLALLSVQPGANQLAILPARASDEVLLGERVVAIGRPFGAGVVASAGVLSAVRGGGRLQADPDLGNANAGGAVVDARGSLVGIVDGGALDPLAVAFAMRGDRVTKESNLSTFVGIDQVRRVFSDELASGVGLTTPLERKDVTNALTMMVDKVAPALLNVYVGSTAVDDSSNPFASVVQTEARVFGLGSGVIIDRSGLALSNWHVVDEAVFADGAAKPGFSVEVSVFGGRKYAVTVLSISRENDLALLQLALQPGESVHAIELGDSAALEIGEKVAAIGNPHGKANTITAGIVTAKEQGIKVRGRWAKLEHLIETDAAINGGNSGGALLDMTGRLVGINSAGGGTFNNRGYAISVDHVRRQLLGLLLAAYKLRSPDLGLSVMDDDGKVVVSLVDARGPAAAAGVQTGDRVMKFAGEEITWSPGFARVLMRQPVDMPVALVLQRKGSPVEVAVAPIGPGAWALVRQSGLACRNLPFAQAPDDVRKAAIAAHRKFTGDTHGEPAEIPAQLVRIEAVHPGIQKADIDLRKGDLLVGVMLRDADTGGDVLMHVADVEALKRLFNDRFLNDYEGQEFRCWIARAGKIHEVDVVAKRLFW